MPEDESSQDQPQPAQPVRIPDPAEPPGEGQIALHYLGDAPLTKGGITFLPDQIVHVDEAVGTPLIGRDGVRVVDVLPEQWANFLAMRARARG